MSTTARDKAWDDRVRKAAREMYPHAKVRDRYDADLLMAGFEDGADWGRASVLSALTEERIARALWDEATEEGDDPEWTWDYLVERANRGDGDYSEIREGWFRAARAVLALIEQETTK